MSILHERGKQGQIGKDMYLRNRFPSESRHKAQGGCGFMLMGRVALRILNSKLELGCGVTKTFEENL